MQNAKANIVILLIATTLLIVILASLVVILIYIYQKKQLIYQNNLDDLKVDHEKNLLASKIEIQENTFQHISREIHDDINLSLTLAKLKLNTFEVCANEINPSHVKSSIELIGDAIGKLSDISQSLNSDIISSKGLISALKNEIAKIKKTGLLPIHLNISGNEIYLDNQKELIIFRIIQEALNNIIKHAYASKAMVTLFYKAYILEVIISDNGKGFVLTDLNEVNKIGKAGLKNMETRANAINGRMLIETTPGKGTKLSFNIPY